MQKLSALASCVGTLLVRAVWAGDNNPCPEIPIYPVSDVLRIGNLVEHDIEISRQHSYD